MSGNLRVSRLEESHEHIIQDYEGGVIKRRELMKTNRGVELSERSSNPATDIFESKLELETMLAKMESLGASDAQIVRIQKLAATSQAAALNKAAAWLESHEK